MTKLVIALPMAVLKQLITLLRMVPRTLQPLNCRPRFCSVDVGEAERQLAGRRVDAGLDVGGDLERGLRGVVEVADEATSSVHEPLALAQIREPP